MSIENYLARRAQMQNQNLQAVQNSLDGLLATYFEHSLGQRAAKLEKQENLMAGLFQAEYKNQLDYENKLLDLGLSIPEEQQTDGYKDVVKGFTGDKSLLETLDNMHAAASHKNSIMKGVLHNYNQGKQANQQLLDAGYAATIPGQPGDEYADYLFDPQEYDILSAPDQAFAEYGFDPTSDAFEKGFMQANRTQDQINESLTKLSNRKNADLALQNQQFNTAGKYSIENANASGGKVMTTIQGRLGANVSLSGLIGQYGKDGSLDVVKEGIDTILDGITIGDRTLKSNGHVSRMIASAVSSTPNYAGDANQANTKGFLDLAVDANDKFNDLQSIHGNYAQKKGWGSIPPVGSTEYKTMVHEIGESNAGEKYKELLNVVEEYNLIGLGSNDIVAEAIEDIGYLDLIEESKEDYVRKLAEDLAADGFEYDESAQIIDETIGNKYGSNTSGFGAELHEIYDDSFITTPASVAEVGGRGISFGEELQKSLDLLENVTSAEDIISQYDIATTEEGVLENNVITKFKDLQTATGIEFDSEMPSWADVQKLKKGFTASLNIHPNMSQQEQSEVELKIMAFNDFYQNFLAYRNIAGQTGSGDRVSDIERIFFEEGYLSEEALQGPRIREARE